MSLSLVLDKIVYYAKKHLDLDELDAIYIRNILLAKFNLISINKESFDFKEIDELTVPDTLIKELKEELEINNFQDIDLLITEVFGLISPLPSQVEKRIKELEQAEKGKGLEYLYQLQIMNYYIRKTDIERNIYFKKNYEDNFLEITINLAKPEKNNKEVALLLTQTKEKYPQCLLCKENLGYRGRSDHPARTNIRYLPLVLNEEKWFLQYSPYAYFDHHIIVINDHHHNMIIDANTFKKLLDFVNQFPTYFIGSNADLPIVGGSILDHEHYQGGTHLLPIFYASDRKIIYDDKKVKISILDWYNSVIKIEGKNPFELVNKAEKILDKWINYDNVSLDIISHTGNVRHSTITPLARKIQDKFVLYLILRNNRTNEKYPDGIFHAHPQYHHIKQEGIGLIEASGLFILPPRLKRQTEYIKDILTKTEESKECLKNYPDLDSHKSMIEELIDNFGNNHSTNEAEKIISNYIADTCKSILSNVAVFKDDEIGQNAFIKFIQDCL